MTLLHFRFIRSKRSNKKFVPNSKFCVFHDNTSFFHDEQNVEEHHSRKRRNVRACELQDKKIAKEEESIAAADSIHSNSKSGHKK